MSTALAAEALAARYAPEDLALFDDDERERFLAPLGGEAQAARSGDRTAWRSIAPVLAWELLYRKEPELWERLVRGERIHEDVLAWLPSVTRAVEVGAGSGRLTLALAGRCDSVIAIEPAAALRAVLQRKLDAGGITNVDVRRGFFDELPLPDASADLVVSCSSFTTDVAHGGDVGLAEMERVAKPGAPIVLVWPSDVDWLRDRGFDYETFDGDMEIDFGTLDQAVELARIFYPWAVEEIERRGAATVPYDVIGMNAPRDLAWKRAGSSP